MTEAAIETTAFDRISPPAARALLTPVCASDTWLTAMVAGRPYDSRERVSAHSDEVIAGLAWADVLEALSAHPRIGERAAGVGREAQWSREEQAAAAGDGTTEEMLASNVAYEERFGHVFLICASGRTSAELLAALRARLANDDATERHTVRRELAAIVRLRLARTLS
jgi:2-oxo-4-hydroxy-4-carboxy-5-ureidoimidazoline decarboxylase